MDTDLLERINHFSRATAWLHPAAEAFATYGVALFALLLAAGWWLARRRDDAAAMAAAIGAGVATPLAVAVNQPLAQLVARPRPYLTHPAMLVLTQHSTDFSFPSDHATMAGAVAAGLWMVSRRLGALATVAALLMALTRVYVGAHYPGDVAAGLVLGALVAVAVHLFARVPLTRAVVAVSRTRLRPLLTAAAR